MEFDRIISGSLSKNKQLNIIYFATVETELNIIAKTNPARQTTNRSPISYLWLTTFLRKCFS